MEKFTHRVDYCDKKYFGAINSEVSLSKGIFGRLLGNVRVHCKLTISQVVVGRGYETMRANDSELM